MLNWKIRYSKIMQDNPELFDRAVSVVEVGSGPLGIAQFLNRPVTGVEPHDVASQTGHLTIIKGSVPHLPFGDREFDIVVCIDVMEHLPQHLRVAAIKELLRISRRKVIISCPCHRWASEGEHELRAMFERCQMHVPGWLQEHLDLGLPSIDQLIGAIASLNYSFEVVGNETMLQHYSGIAMDWMFPMADSLKNRIHSKQPLGAPIAGNEWDLYYSFCFTIFKQRSSNINIANGLPQPRLTRATDNVPEPRLYAIYHREFPTAHLGTINPIFTGEAIQPDGAGGLTDRLSDGSTLPNRRWSELSAIYKIWKDGPQTPIVGFMHYRRLFDFRTADSDPPAPAGHVRQTEINPETYAQFSRFFIDQKRLASIDGRKILVARPNDVVMPVFDDYCMTHNTNDYLDIFNRLAQSPLLAALTEQFTDTRLYSNNMFIMAWDLFDELCRFWFPTLEGFAATRPDREAVDYQKRDIAFLSERIFDAWVRYRKSRGTEVEELPIFFLT